MPSNPLTLHLWLSEARSSEPENVAKRRSLLKPQLDQQSGNFYIELKGQDAFAVARTIPRELIQLITMRTAIEKVDVCSTKPQGRVVYVHHDIEVIADDCLLEIDVFITGNDIAEVQDAYNLFRGGCLLKRHFYVFCPCCHDNIWANHSAIKNEARDSGVMHYIACPKCGGKCIIEFAGEGGMMREKYLGE